MIMHHLKYSLKVLFHSKAFIFWTFAFPLILGTFFQMAFSNIEDSEKLSIIDIAIVKNESFENNVILKQTFDYLGSSQNENQLFEIIYVDEKEAKEKLEKGDVKAYFIASDEMEIVVQRSGIEETVLKLVVDEILQIQDLMQTTLTTPSVSYEKLYQEIKKEANIKDISPIHLSYTMIEFYTLIAMSALYGGIIGMFMINLCLPNMSMQGKRVALSPIPKSKVVMTSAIASYLVQLFGMVLLFLYTIFVLHVDYGDHIGLVILLAFIASLAGLSLGIVVASLFKTSENMKTGIILSFTMLGCFLSGMMGITMKYLVDKNIPFLNLINPASMITDGFYSLYYYDTLHRYWFNVISLLIFSFILLLISSFCLRRQKYEHI